MPCVSPSPVTPETAGSVCAMLAALPLLERVLSLLGELMMTG